MRGHKYRFILSLNLQSPNLSTTTSSKQKLHIIFQTISSCSAFIISFSGSVTLLIRTQRIGTLQPLLQHSTLQRTSIATVDVHAIRKSSASTRIFCYFVYYSNSDVVLVRVILVEFVLALKFLEKAINQSRGCSYQEADAFAPGTAAEFVRWSIMELRQYIGTLLDFEHFCFTMINIHHSFNIVKYKQIIVYTYIFVISKTSIEYTCTWKSSTVPSSRDLNSNTEHNMTSALIGGYGVNQEASWSH